MTGKEKCRLLRQIREEFARQNGIEYGTFECTYDGEDCRGTCPMCDEELAYLNAELRKKEARGEKAVVSDKLLNMAKKVMENCIQSDDDIYDESIDEDDWIIDESPDEDDWSEIDESPNADDWLTKPIEELNILLSTQRFLKRANIQTVAHLAALTEEELFSIDNIWECHVEDVKEKLARIGLSLQTESVGGANRIIRRRGTMGVIRPMLD